VAQGAPRQGRHLFHHDPHQALPLDRQAYRRRNQIERLFCRLKNWRRVAIRFDLLTQNYLASLALIAAVTEWI
jgi:transposase